MILHHYHISPYSEKIRLMFGYTGLAWQSAISPPMPPRPIVDPLVGGYRRIPVAQIGADIFCDTRIISAEIARLSNRPELSFEGANSEASAFAQHANSEIFMPIVQTANPKTVLAMVLRKHWPWQVLALIKDRAKVAKTSNAPRLSRSQMHATIDAFKNDLEDKLSASPFLFGEHPTIADFAAYHLVWFANNTRPKTLLSEHNNARAWQQRMQAFGQGQYTKVNKHQVFQAAKQAQPRALSDDLVQHSDIGKSVTIAPNDYARDKVSGQLVGANAERWIIARHTTEFGILHVHFPTAGYELSVS